MDVATLAQTIQIILTPVVMITACAITLGGLWNHASSINDRLRSMNHERLDIWRKVSMDGYSTERTEEIDTQVPILVRRHRQMLQAIVAMYAAILIFVLSMFAIAGAELLHISATLALLLFLAGNFLVLIAILMAVAEIRNAQIALEYEVNRVAALPVEHPLQPVKRK
jgi:hypothetical protein